MLKKIKQEFTRTEAILTALVVFFILTLVSALPISLRLLGDRRHTTTAQEIVSQKISEERKLGYDNVVGGTVNLTDSRLSALTLGSGTLTVVECPAIICKYSEKIKEVTVQVSWREGSKDKNVSYTTLITPGGLK